VLGERPTIRSLYAAPTVARFAAELTADAPGDEFDMLFALRGTGSRPPVFCVHPAGGLGWCYTGLLRHLERAYPLYALQARGIAAAEPLPATLEELVDDYLVRIRAVQPAGPYHLLGWSFGGVAAYALATRLRARGEEVALLALLDAYPHVPGAAEVSLGAHDILTGLLEYAGHRPSPGDGPLDVSRAARILRGTGSALSALTEDQLAASVRVFQNNFRLQHGYLPGRFDGDLLLFTASTG
jgi:thioesterase domain-containing protein